LQNGSADGAGVPSHMSGNFMTVYAVAAGLAAVAFVVTLWMPNTRLREVPHLSPLSE
jgi:hypothetical protein